MASFKLFNQIHYLIEMVGLTEMKRICCKQPWGNTSKIENQRFMEPLKIIIKTNSAIISTRSFSLAKSTNETSIMVKVSAISVVIHAPYRQSSKDVSLNLCKYPKTLVVIDGITSGIVWKRNKLLFHHLAY